jgi:nucleoside-diphosphate-sugar epimerase
MLTLLQRESSSTVLQELFNMSAMSEPSTLLIVGCGYLGSRVGSLLLSRGRRVVATTTRASRVAELAALGLEPMVLDFEEADRSPAWAQVYGAVVYAAAPGAKGDPRLVFHQGAVECAKRLLEAAPPRSLRFVYISSTGVYHQKDGSEVNEGSPAEPLEERPKVLRQAEEELLALAREHGFPLVILRLGGLYGPGRSPVEWLRRPEMRQRVLRGGSEACMSWVRVEDAASAVVLALEAPCPNPPPEKLAANQQPRVRSGEVYIVVDDEPVKRGEFYRFAAERAGLPPPKLPSLPDDLGKRCSNRKVKAELGFRPAFPSYREGLRDL